MGGIAIAMINALRITVVRYAEITPIDPRRVCIVAATPSTRLVARKLWIATVLVVIVIACIHLNISKNASHHDPGDHKFNLASMPG